MSHCHKTATRLASPYSYTPHSYDKMDVVFVSTGEEGVHTRDRIPSTKKISPSEISSKGPESAIGQKASPKQLLFTGSFMHGSAPFNGRISIGSNGNCPPPSPWS